MVEALWLMNIKNLILFLLILMVMETSCQKVENSEQSLEGNNMGNLIGNGLVASDGKNLYFMETEGDTSKLFKSSLNLKKKEKISDAFCFDINVKDNQIFYVDLQQKVHVMNTDGQEDHIIFNYNVDLIYVYKNKLYAIIANNNMDDVWSQRKYNLISMNFDGSEIKILSDKPVWRMYIENDQIFYLYYTDTPRIGYLQRMELDGSNEINIKEISNNVSNFSIHSGNLYYTCDIGTFKKWNMQSGDSKEVKISQATTDANLINLNQAFVVYLGLDHLYHAANLESEKETDTLFSLRDANILIDGRKYMSGLYCIDNVLYYYDEGKLCRKIL